MKFTLDEIVDWPACASGLRTASKAFKPGRQYLLDESSKHLTREEVFWFLFEKARREPEVMARLTHWARLCGGAVPARATVGEVLAAVHRQAATEVQALREGGVDRAKAKDQVQAGQFEKLLAAFRD